MIHLASKSPRRRELLDQLGLAHAVLDVDVPEQRGSGETALEYVRRVARDKAEAGWAALQKQERTGTRVLAADTEVVLEDEVFGKPSDAAQAAAMLRRLSGRIHQVLSAVCLRDASGVHEALCRSQVRFSTLGEARIGAYLDSGEWQGKAGAYAIQGRAAAFIAHLEGSYSGVMGLPLFETARLLGSGDSELAIRDSS
ncbi:MAG: Maf family nucleotide pyrophosphatase [Aquimonas sp.]|nr:Maf family nucleotide pyrophosphatase [Aquimonas sp.]